MGEEESLHYSNSETEQKNFDRELVVIEQEAAIEYLETEFQNEFITARKAFEHDSTQAVHLAEVQIKYIRALREIAGPNNERFTDTADLLYWDSRVKKALFDNENPDSLQSKVMEEPAIKQKNVGAQFVGATSVLTFINLWKETHPKESRLDMIVADPELDAKGKIDLVVSSGDDVFLVQLKASHGSSINLYPIEDVKSERSKKIRERDVEKMLAVADKWREETGKRVQVLSAEVPGYGSTSIGNVFGEPLGDREGLIHTMQTKREEKLAMAA